MQQVPRNVMFSAVYKEYKTSCPSNILGSVLINRTVRHRQSVPPQITLCGLPGATSSFNNRK